MSLQWQKERVKIVVVGFLYEWKTASECEEGIEFHWYIGRMLHFHRLFQLLNTEGRKNIWVYAKASMSSLWLNSLLWWLLMDMKAGVPTMCLVFYTGICIHDVRSQYCFAMPKSMRKVESLDPSLPVRMFLGLILQWIKLNECVWDTTRYCEVQTGKT